LTNVKLHARTDHATVALRSGGDNVQVEVRDHGCGFDLNAAAQNPEYLGYTVLLGGVHLSRPKTWMLRDGNNSPGQAFVQYVSPKAYSFALYERPESPSELWLDVMKRFEHLLYEHLSR